ncbi:MarR family winged helix-turn-helix transcriptional regulator [Marivirga arenosa]|uniref:MarR family winged helix-turn-helix transcriptional regulator n=1 Tax=Marivirga arenosa TaxID=3059076 RepID=A0AA51N4K8_9BACT|nr:MarR family winged helix-turn-helix transcriptional regulator [Marivirga sp. ABR2-2]WMN06206.1 MarR family winged helix-turn-helix transcriptional regulator [Marivirga sp. ABR2-2]
MLDNGIKLLQLYQNFLKKNPNASLSDFGKSLASSDKSEIHEDEIEEMSKKMPFPFPAKSADEYIGWAWGRLMNFSQIWEKKAFANQPIHNLTEFGVALYVLSHENCSKSEVANHSLQEKTTIFETIKRLVRNGIINEKENLKDKRSKQLSISKKGQIACFSVMGTANDISKHLVGNLSKEEKINLFDYLIKLDEYHRYCYDNYKDENWEKLKEEMLG